MYLEIPTSPREGVRDVFMFQESGMLGTPFEIGSVKGFLHNETPDRYLYSFVRDSL